MKKFIYLIILVILIIPTFSFGEKINFQIIVHSSNPDTTFTKTELSKIFLKKTKRWESSGEKICPVDLLEESETRKEFTEKILDKKISSVKAYWQKQIFSGRGVPPPEKKSVKEVLEYVSDNVGAIAYISDEVSIKKYDVKRIIIKKE